MKQKNKKCQLCDEPISTIYSPTNDRWYIYLRIGLLS